MYDGIVQTSRVDMLNVIVLSVHGGKMFGRLKPDLKNYHLLINICRT
jgi:hypothetical protein